MIIARNSITVSKERDIASVTWYYMLLASTAAPPAKPTTLTPTGWSTIEPTYTEGSTNSLYICQRTVFSDGTFEYSDVSLSSSYEAAKTAYNKSVAALDAVTPIETKTYENLIGTANDFANANFFFAKIHPEDYTVNWRVRLRIKVTVPAAYSQIIDVEFGGYGSTFSSYDSFVSRTGSIGLYYVELLRATSTGINTNHVGHMLGISLHNSTNPANASYKRTIVVELLKAENCNVVFNATAVKYTEMSGYSTTNYNTSTNNLTQMGVASQGQNATNNANNRDTIFASAVKAGSFGVKRYTLLMRDTENTWVSFVNQANNTGTSKTVSTAGHKLGKLIYMGGGSDYSAGSNTATVYDCVQFDFRYSSNCGTTLIANQPIYLVGTIGNDGLFYFDTTKWYTQTVPTSEDGKTYIYVGETYSTYQAWLATENIAYQYYEGKFRTLTEVEEMKAALVADNYMVADEDGLMIADMRDGEATPSTATGRNVLIDSDSVDIRDGQKVLASFGESTIIGEEDNSHLLFDSDSIHAYDGQGNAFFGVDMKGANISIKRTDNFMYVYQPTGEDYQWQCKIHQNTYTVVLIESMVLKNAWSGSEIAWPNKALMILPPPSQYDRIYFLLNDITYSGDFEEIAFAVDGLFFNIVPGTTTAGTSFTKTGNFYIPFSNTLGGGKVNGIYLIISLTYDASTNTITYQASAKLETVVTPNPGVQFRINTYNLAISWTQQTHAPAYFLGTVSGDLGVYSTAIGDNIYASSDRQLAFGKYNINDEDDEYVLIAGNGTADNARSNAFGVTWDGDMHLDLDTSAASGTIDGDLYAAITSLGWGSEVII